MNPIQQLTLTARVIENREIAPNHFLLKFERLTNFRSGQILTIATRPHDAHSRPYSIASSESDQEALSVYYKVVPTGQLTPRLRDLRPGDPLFHSPPFGNFIIKDQNLFLVATGTGIAPFYSKIQGLPKIQNVFLIHGVRNSCEIFATDYFRSRLGPDYVAAISGPTLSSRPASAFSGRVTRYIDQMHELPSQFDYYLCGSAEMVVNVRDKLIARGIPFTKFFSEIYF